MTKRLLFNDDSKAKTGHFGTIYQTVLKNEKIILDTFNKNALSRGF